MKKTEQIKETPSLAMMSLKRKKKRYKISAILGFLIFCLTQTNAFAFYLQSNPIVITGIVTDSEGIPLPGTNVSEKNTNNGAITDFDGNFTIKVSSQNSILVFSYVSLKTVEITVGLQTRINVVLEEDNQKLDEIVLIGYGSQQRKAVSTAVTKVKSNDFNQGVVSSPLDLIQGKVAGLQITRPSGNNPNSSVAIQLRGITSLTGSSSPLIVIDGVPGGNLDLLQQNDIESFDVLKDGAAAAIYGTRGTNGVILITTKKGKKGQSSFNYSTFLSKDYVNTKPNFLSADEFRQAITDGIISADNDLGSSTDIFDELVNESNLTQYHNFVASGGSETGTYRASIYYKDSQGIALENGREEFGVRGSFNQSGLNDKFEFASSVGVNINDANLLGGGQFGIVTDWNPTAPIFAEPGGDLNNEGLYGYYQPVNGYNPFSEYKNRINQRKQLTFSGDIKLSYEFIPGFVASIFGSYQRNSWDDRRYRSTQDYAQYNSGSEYKGTGYAYKGNHLDFTKTLEPTIVYNKDFGDSFFEFLGGYSYQYATTENYSVDNSGFYTDGFQDWNLGAGNAITDELLPDPNLSSFKEDNTLIAYFSRLSYNYKDRYFLQASVRHEGSSRFGANNKWATFPAISGAWVISDEMFMKNVDFVKNLKLRAGYGVTGNQGIPNYQSIVTLGTGGKYPIFVGNAIDPTYFQTYGPVKNPNPNLKWETKKEFNIGLDFGTFSNRLTGSIDIYSRKTEDLLLNYDVPQPPFVQSSIYTNVGDIKNKGLELSLSYRIINKGDFSWTADFVGSYQTNELSKLSNQIFAAEELFGGNIGNPGNLGNAIRNTEGGPIGNFYGKRFAGFTADGKWLFHKADGTIGGVSDMVDEDKEIIGNGLPKYYASFTNTFKYKNLDLTIFFRGKFKYDILNTVDMFYGNQNLKPGILTSALGQYSQISQAPQYSDYYLESGDFIKLDNITLGYNFNLPDKSPITGLRIFGSARNLATFTGYTGRDPEVQDTGLYPGIDDRDFYPRTTTITAGININF
ncbi:SusC/RagA family TonB-linked outer membrane protein [Mariniflexile litorale]|uniref:SusC/RagA family TonB-linked outer membrane protein n=1 Tax=Mariniflexile litorale TaxID=3045158 RepID=A0AAU7EHQ5_9FLAO|nr:SusC/RagA family TonB-linked outer membrane protein [Mariniflexile sp. KMM 9835]MDQ8211952.1 SusC/RagA family TonB-linked outer membrane protein [Mariniflexile sp. KMM 9835]